MLNHRYYYYYYYKKKRFRWCNVKMTARTPYNTRTVIFVQKLLESDNCCSNYRW